MFVSMEQVGKLKPQTCVACPVSQAIRGGARSPEGFWLLLPCRPVRGAWPFCLCGSCAPPPPPRRPDCSCLEVGLVEAWLAWEPGPFLAFMVLSWDFGQVSSCFWASVSSFVKCG